MRELAVICICVVLAYAYASYRADRPTYKISGAQIRKLETQAEREHQAEIASYGNRYENGYEKGVQRVPTEYSEPPELP